ncbi:hypothetical protein SAMN04490240_4110 [Rhodococcus pyridinivorans]|nr:hypothetical protein SAMN04490240_4110 [Rhodococcus pyridinivorans]
MTARPDRNAIRGSVFALPVSLLVWMVAVAVTSILLAVTA